MMARLSTATPPASGGVIGPGDVQWMTAGGGILHEEFHSSSLRQDRRPVPHGSAVGQSACQADKMTAPGYQSILNAEIPTVALKDGAGTARIIAGELDGSKGPARTFTPMNVWDVRLNRDAETVLDLPDGHTSILVVLSGRITVNGTEAAGTAEALLMSTDGEGVRVHADADTVLLVLSGEPIDEPIVGYGPFVMNSEDEIRQAIGDFNSGRFGQIAATA
jgi:redox-sensitive bicupin YhaK (pirin superfamily)